MVTLSSGVRGILQLQPGVEKATDECGTFHLNPEVLGYYIRYRYRFTHGGNEAQKVLPDRPKVIMEVTEQNMSLDLVLLQGQRYHRVGYN